MFRSKYLSSNMLFSFFVSGLREKRKNAWCRKQKLLESHRYSDQLLRAAPHVSRKSEKKHKHHRKEHKSSRRRDSDSD